MDLPFDLPPGRLPTIVPRPKGEPKKFASGALGYRKDQIRYLLPQEPRDRFAFDLALDFQQFAYRPPAERYTLRALLRLTDFSDKLEFPGLQETGELMTVAHSNGKLVWATVPESVIVTKVFTILDLREQGMALNEPDVLRENIEQSLRDCPDADVEFFLKRLNASKTYDPADIRRAIGNLVRLGFIREYKKLDRSRRRVVLNIRMIASTRSGIRRGVIAAADALRVEGSSIEFHTDIDAAEAPAERERATKKGRKKKKTRAEYQAEAHREYTARRVAENKVETLTAALYELRDSGALTSEQQRVVNDAIALAHSDPLTEVPAAIDAKEQHSA